MATVSAMVTATVMKLVRKTEGQNKNCSILHITVHYEPYALTVCDCYHFAGSESSWLGAAEHVTKRIHKSGKENYF